MDSVTRFLILLIYSSPLLAFSNASNHVTLSDLTKFAGESAIFTCDSTTVTVNTHTIRDVHWLINGTPFNTSTHTNVLAELNMLSREGSLVFTNITTEQNLTTIQCTIVTDSDNFTSNVATLFIQGGEPTVGTDEPGTPFTPETVNTTLDNGTLDPPTTMTDEGSTTIIDSVDTLMTVTMVASVVVAVVMLTVAILVISWKSRCCRSKCGKYAPRKVDVEEQRESEADRQEQPESEAGREEQPKEPDQAIESMTTPEAANKRVITLAGARQCPGYKTSRGSAEIVQQPTGEGGAIQDCTQSFSQLAETTPSPDLESEHNSSSAPLMCPGPEANGTSEIADSASVTTPPPTPCEDTLPVNDKKFVFPRNPSSTSLQTYEVATSF